MKVYVNDFKDKYEMDLEKKRYILQNPYTDLEFRDQGWKEMIQHIQNHMFLSKKNHTRSQQSIDPEAEVRLYSPDYWQELKTFKDLDTFPIVIASR